MIPKIIEINYNNNTFWNLNSIDKTFVILNYHKLITNIIIDLNFYNLLTTLTQSVKVIFNEIMVRLVQFIFIAIHFILMFNNTFVSVLFKFYFILMERVKKKYQYREKIQFNLFKKLL